MSQVAILPDIHGNSVALKTVLTDLEEHGGADSIIILGDLVVFGPGSRGNFDIEFR